MMMAVIKEITDRTESLRQRFCKLQNLEFQQPLSKSLVRLVKRNVGYGRTLD